MLLGVSFKIESYQIIYEIFF